MPRMIHDTYEEYRAYAKTWCTPYSEQEWLTYKAIVYGLTIGSEIKFTLERHGCGVLVNGRLICVDEENMFIKVLSKGEFHGKHVIAGVNFLDHEFFN